jgi:NodT family efflux transporter outer membrane factor (OMF) lipoprotein
MKAETSSFANRRSRIAPPLSATLLAGLAACAVGPRYTAPDARSDAPAAFATHDGALSADAPSDRWWLDLGDPTLDSLIERALADNPDLATAEARVQQARALAQVAGAEFYPSVNLGGAVSQDRLSRHGETLSLVPFVPRTVDFTDYRLGFDASWEIDLAGKTRHDVEAAVARAGGALESNNDARLVVAADVADSYLAYRAARQRLDVARRTLADLEETLRLTALEAHAGLASESDRVRAEADRTQAAGALPPLVAEQQSALFELAALIGTSAEALTAELSDPHELPAVPAIAPIGVPADILRRRPDVRQAERSLAAATADVGSAVAEQFPRLTLVGDLGWDSVHTGDLIDAASRYWNLTPQLSVPLFSAGRLHQQVKASEAARDAALGSYRATVLRALSDAESSIVRFASERQREAALAEALASRRRDSDFQRRRFAAGDVSMIDVLAAERVMYQAEDQDISSRAQLARNYVALGKALGGGWQ